MKTDLTDDELVRNWYQFAASQSGFIGYWLRMLREQQKISSEEQQHNLGVSKENFLKLQGMPLPRPNQFTKDARRIAEACHLKDPSVFVQAMLLARSLERNQGKESSKSPIVTGHSYQAAYDADEDLDESPNDDDK
jgi:hypothetical protein